MDPKWNEVDSTKVACIGAGYVGGPTMAVIADRCPNIRVTVVDINPERIAAWNSDKLPVYEPGLHDVVKRCRGRNLFFTTDLGEAIRSNDIIFVSVNTPTKMSGLGAGCAADLTTIETSGRTIAEHSGTNRKIVVEKSTVPVRTAAALAKVLCAGGGEDQFVVLSNPEFLAEGTAIKDLENPDRVLIGGPSTLVGAHAIEVVSSIYGIWVADEKIIRTSTWSSELSKLVANAFLAQRISSINAISQLCDRTGADVREVSLAIGKDKRIGDRFLNASIGFGGSCFNKDILNLVYLCETSGLHEVADYWRKVVEMNEHQKATFCNTAIQTMFGSARGKKVAIFGFAFKKDTGDTRQAPALTVCRRLIEEGAIICVLDPKVEISGIHSEFKAQGFEPPPADVLFMMDKPEEAVKQAHCIIVCTEWDEFKEYDYRALYSLMVHPAYVFDGRNLLDHEELRSIGFDVHGIGCPNKNRWSPRHNR